jgi:hypothetical protein
MPKGKADPKFTRPSIAGRLGNAGLSGFVTSWVLNEDLDRVIQVIFSGDHPVEFTTEAERVLSSQGYDVEPDSPTSIHVLGLNPAGRYDSTTSPDNPVTDPAVSERYSLDAPIDSVDQEKGLAEQDLALADWEQDLLAAAQEFQDAGTIQEAMGVEPTHNPLPEIKPLSPVASVTVKPKRTWYGKKIKVAGPEVQSPTTGPLYPDLFNALASLHGHADTNHNCRDCHVAMNSALDSLSL